MVVVERHEFVAALNPLALAMRAELDKPSWSAYYAALKDIPAPLFAAAVQTLTAQALTYFPKAGELRAACERQRRAVLAAHPYDGCVECEDQRGYRTVINGSGQKTVEPCPCKRRWQQRIAELGAVEPIALLPGEAGVGENEQIYPTVDQLPADLRKQIGDVAARKVLR